jgi:hypothetical protein
VIFPGFGPRLIGSFYEFAESRKDQPGFQQNLAAFKVRNDHNLSYARIFPIFSVGFGYRFW